MKLEFPSGQFDDVIAAVCHGVATEEQANALHELLRANASARDEYILRLELHSRLASDQDLFSSALQEAPRAAPAIRQGSTARWLAWSAAIAACLALVAAAFLRRQTEPLPVSREATSRAVAMLHETAEARWAVARENVQPGAPLEPGWMHLEAGLAEIVFYSGAHVVLEGPAELQILASNHAVCRRGKVIVEIPEQARGFRLDTPHGSIVDLGTSFGLEVDAERSAVHVFKGEVELHRSAASGERVGEGRAVVFTSSGLAPELSADPTAFASLFELHHRASEEESIRLEQWRTAGARLNRDPSLLLRFDFDPAQPSRSSLENISEQSLAVGDATIVGCQWSEGRWPGKRALDFQRVSDRVRLSMPGEFESLTMAAWVRVQGLDRKLNSLFMSDGFDAGTVHWLIRNDGVLGLTVVGPGSGEYQIAASPPVVALDQFGMWIHLAVVLDGLSARVRHLVNGRVVSDEPLRIKPPYRVGTAELGNWNAKGFPKEDPFMIRHFSGAIDEFCLFARALSAEDIRRLYRDGRPEPEVAVARN